MIDQRGRLLVAALEFAGLPRPSYDRALWALRFWLDSWRGIGDIVQGMARQGYDLQLTRYDERGWRTTFYTTGMEHSITSATASAWERTPWHATQRAVLEALETQEEREGVAAVTGAPGLLHHCLSRLAARGHSNCPRVRRSILYRSYMQGSHSLY